MKKTTVFILFILFVISILYSFRNYNTYKVLGVKNAGYLIIDLNNNSQIDDNELVKVYGIKSFSFDDTDSFTYKGLGFSKKDLVYLAYFSKKWAEEQLLNTRVKLKLTGPNEAIIYFLGKDYASLLLKNGYTVPEVPKYKSEFNSSVIKSKLDGAKKEYFVIANRNGKKYHELDCKYGLLSDSYELIPFNNLSKNIKPCKICHKTILKSSIYNNSNSKEKVAFFKTFGKLKIYFLDFSNTKKPLSDCSTEACLDLLNEINNAKDSIDFAIYGIYNQPKIYNALVNAYKNGVKIRWVTDVDAKGNYYQDTLKLMRIIPDYKTDDVICNSKSVKDAIMHDKFFIFDNKRVWTGSANITDTDFSDFNANNAVLVNSSQIANLYSKEFNQLYEGKFHTCKMTQAGNEATLLDENTKINVYFSPQDLIITNQIIKVVDNSKKYVYMPIFYFTSKPLAKSLILARQRGVDVRVITDATNASGEHSVHKDLRKAGVKVKVENKAGKMHMKTIVIDDKYSVIGSMNFTKSGEKYNDESVMIIENPQIAAYLKSIFLYLWQSVPDKYLFYNPQAESIFSIGSCSDGIDNDFDGKIDSNDNSCSYMPRK